MMFNWKHVKVGFTQTEKKLRRKLRMHHFLFAFLGGVGIVLFWYGIWETAGSILEIYPPLSVLIGMTILSIMGIFIMEIVGKEALSEEIEEVERGEKKISKEIVRMGRDEKAIFAELEKVEHEIEKTEQEIEQKKS